MVTIKRHHFYYLPYKENITMAKLAKRESARPEILAETKYIPDSQDTAEVQADAQETVQDEAPAVAGINIDDMPAADKESVADEQPVNEAAAEDAGTAEKPVEEAEKDTRPVLYVKYLENLPEELAYATDGSAGIDLRVCLEGCKSRGTRLAKGVVRMLHTGVSLAIPEGYVGLICMRSGKSAKEGLRLANQVAVIDSDYRGEVMLPLTSTLSTGTYIENYERVAQLVILPVASCRILRDDTSFLTEDGKECTVRACGQHREFLGEFILQTNGNVTIMAAEELPNTKRGTNGFGSTGK